MDLTQGGRPNAAGVGGGSQPSSSFGQRNVNVIAPSFWDITPA
jgi:hypothetical protein